MTDWMNAHPHIGSAIIVALWVVGVALLACYVGRATPVDESDEHEDAGVG